MIEKRLGHGFYAVLPLEEQMRLARSHVDVNATKNGETPASIDDLKKSIDEYNRSESERVQAELRKDIERSLDQCRRFESELVYATRDWSVWNALSYIAFRNSFLLCEIQSEDDLTQLVLNGHPLLRAHDPEALLISALQQGRLRGIWNGKELDAYYWSGKSKVNRDIWFDRDAILSISRADPEDQDSATPSEDPNSIQLSSWVIPDARPSDRKSAVQVAWIAMRSIWTNGRIPKLLASGAPRTIEKLTQEINEIIPKMKNQHVLLNKLQGGRIGRDSVKRALGLRA
jgi:hypothetical protein